MLIQISVIFDIKQLAHTHTNTHCWSRFSHFITNIRCLLLNLPFFGIKLKTEIEENKIFRGFSFFEEFSWPCDGSNSCELVEFEVNTVHCEVFHFMFYTFSKSRS